MFSWSGLIDSNLLMREAFQVPNLKTGKMESMIDVLTEKEEEQFRNMLTRLNTIMTAAKEVNLNYNKYPNHSLIEDSLILLIWVS